MINLTVPVTITPEAEARLNELGFRPQMEQMIERALHHVDGLTHIEVLAPERYDLGGELVVFVDAYCDRARAGADLRGEALVRWQSENFPPEVLEFLVLQKMAV